MAASSLRREVLKSFKKLHRTCCYVFQGDIAALVKAKQEINEHYKKNKFETDEEKIKELIKLAHDVIHEIKTTVLQMKQVESGNYRLNLRPEMFEKEPQNNIQNNRKQ